MGIYISVSILNLAMATKEIVIKAAFGINITGMSLLAVLAELDETGVPLAYLFVEKVGLYEPTVSGNLT